MYSKPDEKTKKLGRNEFVLAKEKEEKKAQKIEERLREKNKRNTMKERIEMLEDAVSDLAVEVEKLKKARKADVE